MQGAAGGKRGTTMRTTRVRRLLGGVALAGVLLGAVLLAPAAASACEDPPISLSAVATDYVSVYGHFLDGVVTNDSTVTVRVDHVDVGWAEDASATPEQVWMGCTLLAPGQWTTFHESWPCDVPATWTPTPAVGYAYTADPASTWPITLTLDSVTGPVLDGDMRVYTATITNPVSYPVSGVELVGCERDTGSSAFVDTLFSWDLCDLVIGPHETRQVTVRGKNPVAGPLTAEMRFTALEKPTISLTADNLRPLYGTAINFAIRLTHADGTPVTGCRTLKIYWSSNGTDFDDHVWFDSTDGTAAGALVPDAPTYYKAVYWGGEDLGWCESPVLYATPKVAAYTPTAPASVRRARAFQVRGRLSAGAKSAGKPVYVIAEKRVGRRWVRRATFRTTASANGSYKASVKLGATGTWRVRAYRQGAGYSPYRALRVRYR